MESAVEVRAKHRLGRINLDLGRRVRGSDGVEIGMRPMRSLHGHVVDRGRSLLRWHGGSDTICPLRMRHGLQTPAMRPLEA